MKKNNYLIVLLALFVSSVLFSGCSTAKNMMDEVGVVQPDFPEPTSIVEATEFNAHFEIFTNGTRRIFTNLKYHNQSQDIYIENPDPHLIFVKKSDLTWADFFNTLPFSLEKDCLVTGTKQTFCNTETKKLFFYLNGQEVPDALEQVIAPNDSLRVEYK